jgi:hypothetical protein
MTWMAWHNGVKVSDFAPRAWGAICELVGGEERIDVDACGWWGDGFIVNLGNEETEGKEGNVVDEIDGWHVDGDFFVHFLDSPEQGLLVVPCWSDVIENGGGTAVCADGIGKVAKWLFEHPRGVDENLRPLGKEKEFEDRWMCSEFVESCQDFFELTGEVGDVFVMHPLMIHSATTNGLRIPRFITNPNIVMRAPFDFDRSDPSEYSLVELKTLKELGRLRLEGWKISGERRPIVQDNANEHEEKLRNENDRLEAAKVAESYRVQLAANSGHSRLPPPIPPRPYLPAS